MWSTSEFPKKRKERDEELVGEKSKWRREEERGSNEEDWFLRKEESFMGNREKRLSKHSSSRRSNNERRPLEEKMENVDTESEASYSYRAPYQGEKDVIESEESSTGNFSTEEVEKNDGKPLVPLR